VSVDEIVLLVRIAVGSAETPACAPGDANHDGAVTVDEVIVAVNGALAGCPHARAAPSGTAPNSSPAASAP